MPVMTVAQLDVDNNYAHSHVARFKELIGDELYARGLHLNNAMVQFAKFTDLPELPSRTSVWLNIGFSALTAVVPSFSLLKTLVEQEKVVAALEAGAKAASTGTKIAERAHEIKEKAAEVAEKAKSIKENSEKLKRLNEPSPLNQLRFATKGPIQELIEARKKAYSLWDRTLTILDHQFDMRRNNLSRPVKETLVQLVERLLPLPTVLTEDELDEVEQLYLYQMIKAWARDNVSVRITISHQVLAPDKESVHVEGMTNSQEETIRALFGPRVPRGRIFLVPLVFDVKTTLRTVWNVKQEVWRTGNGMPRKISATG